MNPRAAAGFWTSLLVRHLGQNGKWMLQQQGVINDYAGLAGHRSRRTAVWR